MAANFGKSKSVRDSTALVLEVLTAIESNANVTQRSMSSQLGVALGLANSVLKRCVRKGLVKISTAPLNRYAYYLTPSGFSEKARLTAEYLRVSFDLFRVARNQYAEIFSRCAARRWTRVVLVGASDLAELAVNSARECEIEIVAIVDLRLPAKNFLGYLVAPALAPFGGSFDAAVLCDMHAPQDAYIRTLTAVEALGLPGDRVLGPALLRLNTSKTPEMSDA